MDTSRASRLKRRHLLANLLFAGGLLTLSSLQPAAATPIEEGWVLPQDLRERLERTTGSRLDPVPPEPETAPTPPPPHPGGVVAPKPQGAEPPSDDGNGEWIHPRPPEPEAP